AANRAGSLAARSCWMDAIREAQAARQNGSRGPGATFFPRTCMPVSSFKYSESLPSFTQISRGGVIRSSRDANAQDIAERRLSSHFCVETVVGADRVTGAMPGGRCAD